jgi:hypothetical protein
MDGRALERSLIDKQVDALTATASSTIPVVQAQKAEHRFVPYGTAGLSLHANVATTQAETLREKPQLCEALAETLLEAAALQLRKPERALDMLVNQVPEIGITFGGRENARLSQGLMQWTMLAPEAMQNGLGWTNMERRRAMTDLRMEFGAPHDEAARTTRASGRGADAGGPSRVSGEARVRVVEPEPGRAHLEIDAEHRLTGPPAQFSRGAVARAVAAKLAGDFARALERRLLDDAGAGGARARGPSAWGALPAWVRRALGNRA